MFARRAAPVRAAVGIVVVGVMLALAGGCGRDPRSPGMSPDDRTSARQSRAALRDARALQPGHPAPTALPPARPSSPPIERAPSALPTGDVEAPPAPPVAPSSSVAPAATASAAIPQGDSDAALCRRLCERMVSCSIEAIERAFGGDDPGALRDLHSDRDRDVSLCRSPCEERLRRERLELERCDAQRECDAFVDCFFDRSEFDE